MSQGVRGSLCKESAGAWGVGIRARLVAASNAENDFISRPDDDSGAWLIDNKVMVLDEGKYRQAYCDPYGQTDQYCVNRTPKRIQAVIPGVLAPQRVRDERPLQNRGISRYANTMLLIWSPVFAS